jgi:hypothetical protein
MHHGVRFLDERLEFKRPALAGLVARVQPARGWSERSLSRCVVFA